MTLPQPIREAYCRRLLRISRDLEHIARIGRPWLRDSQELAGVWEISRASRLLAEVFDQSLLDHPPVPDIYADD